MAALNRTLAELREAVREFVKRYNSQWSIEKNRYLSPNQARTAWNQENMPMAA